MDRRRKEQISEIAKLGRKISESGGESPAKAGKDLLLEREEQFREFFNKMPDAVIILDRKGTLLEASDMANKLSGYTKGELIGKNIISGLGLLDAKTKILCFRKLALHFSGKDIPPFEIEIHTKDGRTIPLEINPRIINYMGKKVDLITLRDVSERRKAEEALRESEERYRAQFEQAMDAIFIADAKTGILLDCNQAATKLVERSKPEIVGQRQTILHPPEKIRGEFSETFRRHITEAQGKTLETQVITKSGKLKEVAIKANIIELGEKRLIQGIFRDITERKKADEELKRMNEQLKSKVEELEKLNKLSVGRELRMVELKKRIEELERKAGGTGGR